MKEVFPDEECVEIWIEEFNERINECEVVTAAERIAFIKEEIEE